MKGEAKEVEEVKVFEFRTLTSNEIELRAATVKQNAYGLLLYKDARCDMKILDEAVTPLGWKREHKELKGNIYCGVSIFNKDIGEWITKWDAGAESYTEKVKGEASDSFKRACFNWGVGRELYTSPFIWINNKEDIQTKKVNGKDKYSLKFSVGLRVEEIEYNDNKEIIKLKIVGKDNMTRFLHGYSKEDERQSIINDIPLIDKIINMLKGDMDLEQKILDKYNVETITDLKPTHQKMTHQYLQTLECNNEVG
jgi:hypothetical protein